MEIYFKKDEDDKAKKCKSEQCCKNGCNKCDSEDETKPVSKEVKDKIDLEYSNLFETKCIDMDNVNLLQEDFVRYLVDEGYRTPFVILDKSILIINGEESGKLIEKEIKKYIN